MNFTRALDSLPLLPRCEETDTTSRMGGEFVRDRDVTRVLLGTTGALPVEGLPAEDLDCFAGRADVRIPASDLVSRTDVSDPWEAGIHPAFVPLVEESRRAQAPVVTEGLDLEAAYGISRGKTSDLWWILGVAIAMAALLLSGAVYDAIPRAQETSAPLMHPVNRVAPAAVAGEDGAIPTGSLASTAKTSSVR